MSPERIEKVFNKLVKENIEEMELKRLKDDLFRAKQLLRAAAQFVSTGDSMTFYDGTQCDTVCFVEDVKILFNDESEEEFLPD